MKKLLSLLGLLLVTTVLHAEDLFSVEQLDLKPGETKAIAVNLSNVDETQGVTLDITLPSGISFVNASGEVITTGNNNAVTYAERTSGFMSKSAKINGSTGALRVGMTFGSMEAGDGELFTFQVKASESASIGVVKINYTNQKLTYGSTTKNLPDMTSDVNIYKTYNVTVAANDAKMGSVTGGNAEAMSGVELTVTATANTGYEFVNWTDDTNTEVSANAVYKFTPTTDVTLTANFKASVFKATFISEGKSEDKDIAFGTPLSDATIGVIVKLVSSRKYPRLFTSMAIQARKSQE